METLSDVISARGPRGLSSERLQPVGGASLSATTFLAAQHPHPPATRARVLTSRSGLRRSPPWEPDSIGAAILLRAPNERKAEVTVIIRLLAYANRPFLGARFDNSTGNAKVTWDESVQLVIRPSVV